MFGEPEDLEAMQARLVECEMIIADARAEQTALLCRMDVNQVHQRDGHRNLADWTAATLDVTTDTARQLVQATRLFVKHRSATLRLDDGEATFDRALATARLAAAGADAATLVDSYRYDLAGVARLAARHRRVTPRDEREVFAERQVAMQPSPDGTSWRLWGELSGVDGDVVHRAITQRADQLRLLPHGGDSTRAQLSADALVAIAQDSLNGNGDDGWVEAASGPRVSIFVNAGLAARTNGEAGVEIATGPRVGPETLESILCDGTVQVIGIESGRPVVASTNSRTIPPAVRRFVLYRDGGCTVAGCSSRYRLQPHHIIPRSLGGSHDPDNLTCLCWFHHHVAIHGNGFRIDRNSPPQQRLLLPPAREPPERAAA